MAIQFNVEPYWDDFEDVASGNTLSPKEQYQKILFRPGKAIQARELTQLQTALQHQISAHGDHVFKDGSVVVPGAVHLHNKIDYVRLSACNTSAVTDIVGTEYSDGTNIAKVIHAALASGDDSITIWVQYISGTVFANGASLTATGSKTATVANSNDANSNTPIGFGSIVSLEDGIYYIKKHFVTAKSKTIILSKYTSNVSFDIGLLVTESLVSSGSDASLNDNATGTPNAAAPGAHRYSITATLSTQAVNVNDGNFVLIARLEAGIITKNARTADYNLLQDEFARRTFDESGNYYVNPFKALVKTHQVSSPDATKLTLAVEPSKAYVRGYEIQTLATTNVHFDRARTSEVVTDKLLEITHNNYIEVTAMTGTPDITTFGKISIENSGGSEIGTCRARSIERVSGNGASVASRYRVHIFEVVLDLASYPTGMAVATQLDDKEGTAVGTAFAATIAQTDSVNTYNFGPDSLVYELPYERIKTLNGATSGGAVYDFSYNINRIIGSATVSGSGTATFTAESTGEQFGSKATNLNWILINDTNDGEGGEEIVIDDIAIDNSPSGGGAPVVVISGLPTTGNLGGGGSDGAVGDTVRLIAPITRTLTHKTKTLSSNTTQAFNAGTDFSAILSANALGHADIYELVSVVETSGSTNVTTHFDLDNGQKDTHYDVGHITLKSTSNYTAAVALTVTYKYFAHTAGDFFSVDSYTGEIAYADIPKQGTIELRAAIDFRPRIDNDGVDFTTTGASTTFVPTRYSQFSTDIQFYLPRIDKVYLDFKGNFGISPGVPARYPEPTNVPSDAMHLYTMTIPAYTLNPGEVTVDFIDQRRYTMRDIGKIEKRLNQVEYYSVLSFLEAEAQNKQILDVSNKPRWKSGYLVDAFSNTRMSNSASTEYRASVDINKRILRPPFSQGNAALSYHNTGGDKSTTQKTGDLVTLPYTSAALITQGQYSGNINVNPYDVFNWTGSMSLTPSTDEWRDIDRRPEVVINNDGEFDAMMAILEPQVGTVWGEWSTNWSGSFSTRREGNWRVRTETGSARRTGVQQTIEVQTSRFSTGDRIVEVNFIPFMRTRLVAFTATRMKPATQVYAYFDGTSVTDYVKSGSYTYEPLVGVNTVTAHPGTASTLTTDANGAVSGTFLIPNNSALNFPTGQKEFKLTQSSTNDDEVTETSATANYNAAGLIETRENVIISTRTPIIQRLSVGDTRGDERDVSRTRINWEDPLAQSILLDQAAFITSVALNFTSKDDNIPVNVSIREMSNGFPTQKIIPFSDITLNPGSVSISAATTFTFASPVFLQDGIEYAIVIMSNSNKYNVRYAQIGDLDQNGDRINQQPYAGVLFKSQNASTWTADQNKDLMFTLNRAVFTTLAKNCVLRNAALPSRQLVVNPLTTVVSTASATNIFTCAHRDHGMKAADKVTFAGFAATNGYDFSTATTAGGSFVIGTEYKIVATGNTTQAQWVTAGVPSTTTAAANVVFTAIATGTGTGTAYAHELNKIHTITAVTRDSYTVTVAGSGHIAAITAGNGGGTACAATQHLAWNTIHPIIQQVVLPNTTQTLTIKDSLESSGAITSTAAAITANEDYIPLYPKVIKSGTTETIQFDGTFTTTSNYLSPVIDLERCSVITISNRLDNKIYRTLTGSINPTASISVTGVGTAFLTELQVGNRIIVSGEERTVATITSATALTVTAAFTDVADDTTPQGYTEETPSDGTNLAKYVTKTIELNDTSDGIKIYLDINRPNGSFVDLYYKTGITAATFDTESWVLQVPIGNNGVVAFSDGTTYDETSYTITPASDFTIFAIKIVMRSTGTSLVPMCQDLRAIALKV